MSKNNKKKYDKILNEYFGYEALKDLQYDIITHVIECTDVIALMPTSYGKSICYQMPFLITNNNVIVVSPLISLMEDQMRELKEKNIDAVCFNSTNKRIASDLEEIYNGKRKIIYTTPEYLANNHDFISNLIFVDALALIAIDECHCISNWGHSFRSEYKQLGFLKTIAPNIPILALTATATDKVINDVAVNLNLIEPKIIKHSIDRTNLYIEVVQKNKHFFEDKFIDLINKKEEGKTLIYCKTVKETDKVAEKLKELNYDCESYHAKKSSKERTQIQSRYTSGDLDIIVSTIAFGMGINIPNIRLMIHYNCSNDVESYLQEIGRAGRDGKLSKCYLFWSEQDFALSRTFLEDIKDIKIKLHKEADISYLKKYVTTSKCRRHCILKYFGESMDSCVNCDNCLSNKYMRDFTKETYLLLSLMAVFPNNFGINTYVKILLGSKDKTVARHVETAKMFHGKGNCYSEEWWKKFISMLFNNGFIIEEKIKTKQFLSFVIIKPSPKGNEWLYKYKHGDQNKKPSFEISIPDNFKKIDVVKPSKESTFIENYKKMFKIDDTKFTSSDKKTIKQSSNNSSDNDSKKKPVKKTIKQSSNSSSDNDSKKKPVKKTIKQSSNSSSDNDSKKKPVKKTIKKQSSNSSDSDNKKKPVKKTIKKQSLNSSSDDDNKKKPVKKIIKKPIKQQSNCSSNSSSNSDE